MRCLDKRIVCSFISNEVQKDLFLPLCLLQKRLQGGMNRCIARVARHFGFKATGIDYCTVLLSLCTLRPHICPLHLYVYLYLYLSMLVSRFWRSPRSIPIQIIMAESQTYLHINQKLPKSSIIAAIALEPKARHCSMSSNISFKSSGTFGCPDTRPIFNPPHLKCAERTDLMSIWIGTCEHLDWI